MKNFRPNPLLDQFFLIDKKVVEKMVQSLEISKKDIVLEIGAGNGVLTRQITKLSPRVIAIEIDKHFANELKSIPRVKVIIGDALKFLKTNNKSDSFNKVISSLPSSLVEPLMHILPKINFESAVFLIPLKFAYKLINNKNFSIYFKTGLIEKVKITSFFPRPKTNWAMIKIVKKENPLEIGDYGRFIKKYIFEHPNAKPKNALIEALILIYKSKGEKLTKNQARKLFFDLSKKPSFN